jgi:hypothetical protein
VSCGLLGLILGRRLLHAGCYVLPVVSAASCWIYMCTGSGRANSLLFGCVDGGCMRMHVQRSHGQMLSSCVMLAASSLVGCTSVLAS